MVGAVEKNYMGQKTGENQRREVTILKLVVREGCSEGFTENMTFKQRPKKNESVRECHMNT